MAAGDVIQEYVVKLTTAVDNQGVKSIMNFLDSGKFKAMGIAAALSAATTAVYTFVKSTVEHERELEALSKKQKKTIETVRAQENALKSMGKTLKEVQKDANLKKTYNELVKINKEMALPSLKQTMSTLNGLRSSFWELKDSAQYAIDWIGARVISNLEEPVKRITDMFGKVAKWLRDNLTPVTTKIAQYLTGFSKGIIAIGEGFMKVFSIVNALDPGVKKIGTAILAVWAIIKSGPIGMILAAITAIGDLIHDFDNFKRQQELGVKGDVAKELYGNKRKYFDKTGYLNEEGKNYLASEGFSEEKIKHIVGVGMSDVWGALYNEQGEMDIGNAASKAVETLTKKINEFLTGEGQINLADIFKFEGEGGEDGGLLGKVASWIESNQEGLEGLGNAIFGAIRRAVELVVGEGGSGLIQAAETIGKTLIQGISTSLSTASKTIKLDDVKDTVSTIVSTLISLMTEALGAISGLLDAASQATQQQNGEENVLVTLVRGIIGGVMKGFETLDADKVVVEIDNIINSLIGMIISGIANISTALDSIDEEVEEADGEKAENIVITLVKGILSSLEKGFEKISGENVVADINNIVTKVFKLITGSITSAVDLVFGKDKRNGEYQAGLLEYGATFAKNMFKFIAEGIKRINVSGWGTDIGTFINNLFGKIGTFLSLGTKDIQGLPASIIKAGETIATSLFEFIINGLTALNTTTDPDGKTGIVRFIEGLIGMITGTISETLDALLGDGAEGTESESLVQFGTKFVEDLLDFITQGVSTLPTSEWGTQIGTFANELFTKIGLFLTDAANDLGSLPDSLLTAGEAIATSLFGFISSGLDALLTPGDNGINAIGTFISGLFNLISTGISGALALVIGKENEVTGEYESGLLQFGVEFVHSIFGFITQGMNTLGAGELGNDIGTFITGILAKISSFLMKGTGGLTQLPGDVLTVALSVAKGLTGLVGQAFKGIGTEEFGGNVGDFINNLFGSISTFISDNKEDLTKLPSDIIDTLNDIAGGIAGFFSSALKKLVERNDDGNTAITELVDSLWGVITGSIDELWRRLTNDVGEEDHIDFTETGEKIGSTIGKAIVVAVDFLEQMITDIYSWINRGGAAKLIEAGKKIGEELLAGIVGALGDIIGERIFGDEWREFKQRQGGTAHYDENGEYVPQETYDAMTPEEQAAIDANAGTVTVKTRAQLLKEYGFDDLNLSGDRGILDVFNQYNTGGKIMLPWWGERGLLDSLVKDFGNAYLDDSIDMDTMASAFARLRKFIDLWNAGERGTEFFTAEVNKAGEQAVSKEDKKNGEKLNSLGNAAEQTRNSFASANSAVQGVIEKMHELASIDIPGGGSDGGEEMEAYGGRIGSETKATIGEDGPEYIIPISKTERAAELIQQMLGEMGSAFTQKLIGDLGLGGASTNGADFGSIASAMSAGATVNLTYNISAPCNINVSASGVSAQDVGEQAYNAAQRHLLRTLRGVFA